MTDSDKIPRTARDALIIELLGDIGAVHDLIKNLPQNIDQAVSGSIKLVADAVEDAEKTASLLAKGIEAQKATVIKDIDLAVKNSLDQHAINTFSSMEEKVNKLQHKINSFELADPKGRRLSFIISSALILVIIFSMVAIGGFYFGANGKIEELNQMISLQDKMEKKGLSALSPQAREQYQSAKEITSN